MKKIILALVAVLALSTGYAQEIIHLDTESFKAKVWDFDKNPEWVFEGDKVVIVDFYADWCGPCKMLAPILEELQTEYGDKIQVYKVNTDDYGIIASKFDIRGIPTLIMSHKGGDFKKLVGYRNKAQLKTEVDALLAK